MRPLIYGWVAALLAVTGLVLAAVSVYQVHQARQAERDARLVADSALSILRRAHCIWLPDRRTCAFVRDPADTIRAPIRP